MFSAALNLLFPPQCMVCESIIGAHGALCTPCWQKLAYISEPMCMRCGHPFDYSLGEGALCASCIKTPPPYTAARAVLRYDEHSRALVLKLKYQDEMALAVTYGEWLAQAAGELLPGCDAIVPVPLHYWRLVGRRYNQAAVLAHALSRQCGIPVCPDALLRTRPTPTQTGMTHKQREDNVRGAFAVHPKRVAVLADKAVLLVDDVMTTGATLVQCSKALLSTGVRDVYVLTLARRV